MKEAVFIDIHTHRWPPEGPWSVCCVPPARLAEVLLFLADDFGLGDDGALRLNVSREDLSNFVGTATETLIRLLSELKAAKIVESKGRKIVLLNIPELKRLAEE